MKITVYKMSIIIDDKSLWAFLDVDNHTIIQVLSKEYPEEMFNYLNKINYENAIEN